MKLILCGDTSPTIDNNHLFQAGDLDTLFADTLPIYKQADFAVLNLEVALTEQNTPIKKIGPALSATPAAAKTLKEAGFTHCGLSNNHFYDMGKEGVADTLAALDASGLGYTGFGMNKKDSEKELVLEKDGKTVCILAVCEHEYSYALADRMGCWEFDPFETPLAVRAAKEKYDRVVVMYHGGKEQCHYPSPRLHKACHAMAKSGADVILCQHSHCIGTYEEFEGCHIVYGQGNFHFAKEAYREKYEDWHEGLILRYDTDANRLEFIPLMAENGCIRLANAEEKARILDGFASRSQSLQDGTWKDGWHAFCEKHREVYTRSVARAFAPEATESHNQMFAHYLDCEAHTDVWRELFPTYNVTDNQ